MGLDKIPTDLKNLHYYLGEALHACGYQAEKRAYAPHVTLMRNLTKQDSFSECKAIQWSVKKFVLVESIAIEGGVKYEVIDTFNF